MPEVDLLVPGSLAIPTGGYRYDRRIFEGLGANGWKTRIHTVDGSFPSPTPQALAEAASLLRALPDGRRIVIDGLVLSGLSGLLRECASRLRLIALIHHPLGDETGLDPDHARRLTTAEIAALECVHRVVVTSTWTRQRLRALGLERADIVVIEPGVDPGPVRQASAGSHVRLLCVGSLTPRKGHALLIRALGTLRHLDWSLVCVGSPDLDRQCAVAVTAAIASAGLDDRIHLRGALTQAQLALEYAAADLFVLPSLFEGYGMALAEAVASGLPVLSTTGGAIPGTVPGSASRLVPPGDCEALTRALETLILDSAAREQLAQGARRAAAHLPQWPDAVARFAAMLNAMAPA